MSPLKPNLKGLKPAKQVEQLHEVRTTQMDLYVRFFVTNYSLLL